MRDSDEVLDLKSDDINEKYKIIMHKKVLYDQTYDIQTEKKIK